MLGLLQRVLLVLLLTAGLVTMHTLADRAATSAPMGGMNVPNGITAAPQQHRTADDRVPAFTWTQGAVNDPLSDSTGMWECLAVLLVLALLTVAVGHAPGRRVPGSISTARREPAPPPFRTPLLTPVLRI